MEEEDVCPLRHQRLHVCLKRNNRPHIQVGNDDGEGYCSLR